MKETELKPCPFCGGHGRLEIDSRCEGFGCNTTYVYVTCQNCGASGGKADSYFCGSDETYLKLLAIDSWERRADNEQRDGD